MKVGFCVHKAHKKEKAVRNFQKAALPKARPALQAGALLSTLLLGACVVGPDYHRPTLQLDAGFVTSGTGTQNETAVSASIAQFWKGFGDTILNGLIDRALQENGDIHIAEARLREARANQGVADAETLPTITGSADVTRSVIPSYQFPGVSRQGRTYTGYDASFVASWELDLFGRAARGRESAAALTDASAANVGGARVSVCAEVARNYLLLRGTQQRYLVTELALGVQRDSLQIAQARYDAGRATELDLRRAQNLVETTQSQLPALQATIELASFRLATLTAQSPRAVLEQLQVPGPLPGLPVVDLSKLPIGTPEQWLQRRPDLIAAERQVQAASANIGLTRADLFPQISLSGLLGLSSSTLRTLTNSDSLRYGGGPTISWTVFDFGRIKARVAGAEARTDEALATYVQAVNQALEETEGAFTQFTRGAQRTDELLLAADHAEAAAKLARMRYEAGVTDFLPVLDAERDALSSRDQLVQSQTDNATSLVAVYRTLGGGWAAPANVAATPAAGAAGVAGEAKPASASSPAHPSLVPEKIGLQP